MELETIEFEISDHIATITLNRPEAMNSFNDRMGDELVWAWETVRDTVDIHVAIVQANGERAFCTGADVKGGMTWIYKESGVWDWEDPARKLSPKLHHRCWKPVVTAVQGLCCGGGMYFVNEADIVLCSEDASFFDPHADAGIVSTCEGVGMLARGVPLGDVLRWALMGSEERITAATALRLGIVTEVTATDDLRSKAREIAEVIAARSPVAIQGSVRGIWESLEMHRSAGLINAFNYTTIGNPSEITHPPSSERREISYR
jgi:enoyl-CoA hydratase/carnithine racemase